MSKTRILSVAFLIIAALASCGRQGGVREGGTSETSFHWDEPILNGIEIGTEDVSSAGLMFTPIVPEGLGDPVRIVVTPPDQIAEAVPIHRQIAWIYDDLAIGRFVVMEALGEGKAIEREQADIADQEPGCRTFPATEEDEDALGEGAGPRIECHYGNNTLLTVRDGYEALLLEGQTRTALEWVEPLDPEDAEAVKDLFVSPALLMVVIGPASEVSGQEAISIAQKI